MLKFYRGLSRYAGQLLLLVLLLFGQSFTLLFLPNMMSLIVDKGVVDQNIPYILQHGLLMLCIALGGSLCAIGVGYFASKIG
ncbi:ABC transporter ATP-binding protein, partial [Ruminococcaceae bacterium OttesenSCG-928-I18]|nr:ABC transporter ATP-binding protein [Ruminococcaceae bacterium OttesenSCG-928-I18]